jgi:antitoxin VapB
MALNLKDPETHRLARELAEATGKSMSEAVTEAIRLRLEQLRRERAEEDERWCDELLAIAKDIAAEMREPWRSTSIDELFYDENGLPR